ncbi:haloacid dehalogenase type II [Pseudonocardia sp. D17]|uniref:haloacid dehalogenase type II n=1 Tax=Pseudonocardia sp. D17 TaxID=882661 RepID=UPI0030CEB23A
MTRSGQRPDVQPPDMSATERDTLLFDLYGTLVDPLAIATALTRYLPDEAAQRVAAVWRQKQLEYSFRLTMMERYRSFAWVTARSLDYALLADGHELPADARASLLDQYDAPEPFPDVEPALCTLTEAGHSLYVLSNGSPEMLQRCLMNSGLADHFVAWLSVDAVGAFKPSPQVYQHAGTMLGCTVGQLWLVSCNPFDVIGAKSAGMRTAWLNRSGGPFDTIGDQPDVIVSSLDELATRLARP